jgi:PAS domain S-box-containing protein
MEKLYPQSNRSASKESGENSAAWRLLDAVWEVPVGLGLCDAEGRFVRVNAALATLDGLSIEAHYDPDALKRLPAELAEGLRGAGSGSPHDVEFIFAGRSVLVKLHSVLRPGDLEPIGIGIVALDVTDERAAFRKVEEANRLVAELLADTTAKEVALTRLIDSVQEGVVLVDPTGRVKKVNVAAERIMGAPRGQLVGVRFEDGPWWNPDGTGPRDAAALVTNALEQADFVHGELHVETDTGRADLLADATALRDARGRVEDVVVSLRDITAEKRLLEGAQSDLHFQQQVIGIVGHDLRNPLATIMGSIGLLRRQAGLTATSVASLDRVARSAARMARLISDLLDYARTRATGGLPVVLTRVDLGIICRDSVDECRAAHPAARIMLESIGDTIGSWDADRLEQALTNLIINAIQHGGEGAVRVQCIASAADTVEIKVHNRGLAIPPAVLPELFKAYRRGVRGESAGVHGGLGLGLFIVAQIAEAHGGRAYAESSNTDGTTFTVELPRAFPTNGP